MCVKHISRELTLHFPANVSLLHIILSIRCIYVHITHTTETMWWLRLYASMRLFVDFSFSYDLQTACMHTSVWLSVIPNKETSIIFTQQYVVVFVCKCARASMREVQRFKYRIAFELHLHHTYIAAVVRPSVRLTTIRYTNLAAK